MKNLLSTYLRHNSRERLRFKLGLVTLNFKMSKVKEYLDRLTFLTDAAGVECGKAVLPKKMEGWLPEFRHFYYPGTGKLQKLRVCGERMRSVWWKSLLMMSWNGQTAMKRIAGGTVSLDHDHELTMLDINATSHDTDRPLREHSGSLLYCIYVARRCWLICERPERSGAA